MYVFRVFTNLSNQPTGYYNPSWSSLNVSRLHRSVARTTNRRLGSRGFESSQNVEMIFIFVYVFVQGRTQ